MDEAVDDGHLPGAQGINQPIHRVMPWSHVDAGGYAAWPYES